jgi:hypothetical protein
MKLFLPFLAVAAFAQPIVINCGSATDQFFSGGVAWNDPTLGPPNTLRFGTLFSYTIPVTPGFYMVTLGLIEPNQTAAGKRLFIASVNGQASAPIDIFAAAGLNKPAYSLNMAAFSGTGQVIISFNGLIGNAVVSTITIAPFPSPSAKPGTIVACSVTLPGLCAEYPDGSFLLTRIPPPAQPGSCSNYATGSFAIDENGYLYVCSVPWWNMITNMPAAPSSPQNTIWLRSAQPMVTTWPMDRPAGQPTSQ